MFPLFPWVSSTVGYTAGPYRVQIPQWEFIISGFQASALSLHKPRYPRPRRKGAECGIRGKATPASCPGLTAPPGVSAYCAGAAPADGGPFPAGGLSVSQGRGGLWGAPSLPSEPSCSTLSYTVQRVLLDQSPPFTAHCLYSGFTPRKCVQSPPPPGCSRRPAVAELDS